MKREGKTHVEDGEHNAFCEQGRERTLCGRPVRDGMKLAYIPDPPAFEPHPPQPGWCVVCWKGALAERYADWEGDRETYWEACDPTWWRW